MLSKLLLLLQEECPDCVVIQFLKVKGTHYGHVPEKCSALFVHIKRMGVVGAQYLS